jgi:hypothetical protein
MRQCTGKHLRRLQSSASALDECETQKILQCLDPLSNCGSRNRNVFRSACQRSRANRQFEGLQRLQMGSDNHGIMLKFFFSAVKNL